MFSKELKYKEEALYKLERINKFLALFYTSHCVTAKSAVVAPIHDLQRMKSMLQYKQEDYELATSVLKKMSNHRWYLLFSSRDSMSKSAKESLQSGMASHCFLSSMQLQFSQIWYGQSPTFCLMLLE